MSIGYSLESAEKKTIVVAMSGGVDSSVVAAMLHEQGHNVIGITLQLYDHGAAVQKANSCCAGQDIYDAKLVADQLGFPHYVFDYESKFKQAVIDDFADSYLRGETPLPCVKCNQSVKFHDLLQAAKELNADALATGHYVQKIHKDGHSELHQGKNPKKDQSYFLFSTTKEQLDYLIFPLGGYDKAQTRQLASNFGLEIANKADSQDICFVPNGNYRTVIKQLRPEASNCGQFMHIDGFFLGNHQGILNYTIGQRRGLGVSYGEPLYVIRIDPEANIVYLGPESSLAKTEFLLKGTNWLADDLEAINLDVLVKIRSTTPAIRARINKLDDDRIKVTLLAAEKAITPGQACVFYQNTRLLGGGWITREIK